jgi:hypothetical protein
MVNGSGHPLELETQEFGGIAPQKGTLLCGTQSLGVHDQIDGVLT